MKGGNIMKAIPGKNFLLLLLLTFLIASDVLPAKAQAETLVRVGGTGAALGTMKLLGRAFEKANPGTKVQIVPSLGSAGGIKAVIAGSIDIAIGARPLKDADKQAGAIAAEFARSPFVFVVHREVSESGVTINELVKIYSGQAQAWPDGSRIRLILRPETEADTKTLKGISPEMEKAVKSAMSREGMIVAVTDQDSADAVEKTPGALGGGTLTQVLSEGRRVKVLSFNGIKPSVSALEDGSYPLFKAFSMVTAPKTSPPARQFAEFVRSKAGGKILTENGNLVMEAR